MTQGAHLTFYFDVTSPETYIAANRLGDVAKYSKSQVIWVPVVEKYLVQHAAQFAQQLENAQDDGKDVGTPPVHMSETGSGTPSPAPNAVPLMEIPQFNRLFTQDFERELKRYGLVNRSPNKAPRNDLKTDFTDAALLLCAFPNEYRPLLAQALFRAFYVDNKSITSRVSLLTIARGLKLTSVPSPSHVGPFSMTPQLPFALDETVFTNAENIEALERNNIAALQHGAFRSPAFWIEETNKLFIGQDRLVLVEAELISVKTGKAVSEIRRIDRLHPRCLRTPPESRRRDVYVWVDFASAWSFLGWSQLARLQREAGSGLHIHLKPFSLKWMYEKIGHVTDSLTVGHELQRRYLRFDLEAWSSYWTGVNAQEIPPLAPVKITFPHEYPLDSSTALLVALVHPETTSAIFYATWRDNARISDPAVLANALTNAGFDGDALVADVTEGANTAVARSLLEKNNSEALDRGIVVAPTYQFGPHLVFGQNRLNVITDLVLGWNPDKSKLKASVAAFPHFDYRL